MKTSKIIFQEFRRGVFFEEIYEKYNISQDELIRILTRNIKGNYRYQQILSGGLRGQRQFLKHLNSHWNPLEPDAPWKKTSPYLPVKERETE